MIRKDLFSGTRTAARARRAFSLIEMIAILAIVAVFALVLLRALVREIDVRYIRQERAALKTYSEALQRGIMRHGFIPDPSTGATGWAVTVANETGVDAGAVRQNSRRQPRILLVDPSDIFGPTVMSLPYTQPAGGIFRLDPRISIPTRARFILASSVGRPLPISAGLMSTNDFAELWDTRAGMVPTNAAWSGFPPDDLALERIDLSPRFVMLSLTTQSKENSEKGQASIGTNTALVSLVDDEPRFYLENTVVRLHHSQDYSPAGALDSQHILIRGAAFHYANHVWFSGDTGGPKYGGLDLAAVARQFMTCVPNLNAPPNQQAIILQSMINFMKDYVAWKDVAGFSSGLVMDRLIATQQVMMVECQKIFKKNIGRYPVNAVSPCLP